ncbi:MAG: hypothetical protein ACI81V_000713 [Lentimonas sp.]|jgi:hypothetical protein
MFRFFRILSFLASGLLLPLTATLWAEDIYMEPVVFLEQSFESAPEQKVLWLTKDVKTSIESILGRNYSGMRIRYWQAGQRTAWILEEIGKVKLITAGFVVEAGVMRDLQVLTYRESHGWEVRYPFFTDQFDGLQLQEDRQLDRKIDSISGATLSVNSLTRLARLALHLHQTVTAE